MAQGINPITLRPLIEEEVDVEPVPGELPPLLPGGRLRGGLVQPSPSSTLRGVLDQIEQEQTPIVERGLLGEAGSSFLRGAVPGALETTGQALRGVGFEGAGTAVKGSAESVREAAPSLFRPSAAAQQPGTWSRTVATAFESIGTAAALTVPTMGLAALTGGGAVPILTAFALTTPLVYGSAEFQNVYDEGRAVGIPDDVLRNPALQSAAAEGGFELLSNVAEVLMLRSGLSRMFTSQARNAWRQGIKRGMTQPYARRGPN